MYHLMKKQKQYAVAKEILSILQKEKKNKSFVNKELTTLNKLYKKNK